MSKLDRAIDFQVANLDRRRHWLHRQKRQLGRDARNFCGKPATLAGAFLTGAVLGSINEPRAVSKQAHRVIAGGSAVLRHQAITSLQLLALNTVVGFFSKRRARTERDRAVRNTESTEA